MRIDSAPINPSDLLFMSGDYFSERTYPCVAGFEGSGTVLANGYNY